jgi:hypothetical protein
MTMITSQLKPLGAIFTPPKWSKWALLETGTFQAWCDGASVLDPTAGNGAFLRAMLGLAKEQDVSVSASMLVRLHGVEREAGFVEEFFTMVNADFGIDFPRENFICADILLSAPPVQADIIIGNPPWENFTNLPADYKNLVKPLFYEYGLVASAGDVLLGNSRADIAALIIAKTLVKNLLKGGQAHYFLPLSIFLNDGAHEQFRSYRLQNIDFAVQRIYDCNPHQIFDGIATRYGFASFQRDTAQQFPIPYFIAKDAGFTQQTAEPMYRNNAPLTVTKTTAEASSIQDFAKIPLPEKAKPRQGANTCGANDVFIFDNYEIDTENPAMVRVSNTSNAAFSLPKQFVYPLVAKVNFTETAPRPRKWILLPHNSRTGKPLTEAELQVHETLWQYLSAHKERLAARKGTLIHSLVAKGLWWALLGVGAYSFAPYKIFWEAFGQKTFTPRIFSTLEGQAWQGNQALHASICTDSLEEAERICAALRHPNILTFLQSQRMDGTCNWAQPGRISKLLSFTSETESLFG